MLNSSLSESLNSIRFFFYIYLFDNYSIKLMSSIFLINFDFQIFFLGIILLPIRALLVALILLLAWPLAAISTACYPEKLTHPITGWKR